MARANPSTNPSVPGPVGSSPAEVTGIRRMINDAPEWVIAIAFVAVILVIVAPIPVAFYYFFQNSDCQKELKKKNNELEERIKKEKERIKKNQV